MVGYLKSAIGLDFKFPNSGSDRGDFYDIVVEGGSDGRTVVLVMDLVNFPEDRTIVSWEAMVVEVELSSMLNVLIGHGGRGRRRTAGDGSPPGGESPSKPDPCQQLSTTSRLCPVEAVEQLIKK